jgi:hypothetical protein
MEQRGRRERRGIHWVATPNPPPPSKPSTHGSSLLVLCSQRHPHHPQHERQEVNSPRPARAVHATGFSLARLIILLSSPSSPHLSSPSSSSSNHSPPPCGLSLIEERSPSPFTAGTSRTSVLIVVPPDRMIPSSGRPPVCDTSLALYGTHPVAVSTLSSSALSIRHPPSTMHSPRWRHLASSRTIAPLVE